MRHRRGEEGKEEKNEALTSVAQLVGIIPQSKRSLVPSPVRVHAWVAGLIPS